MFFIKYYMHYVNYCKGPFRAKQLNYVAVNYQAYNKIFRMYKLSRGGTDVVTLNIYLHYRKVLFTLKLHAN